MTDALQQQSKNDSQNEDLMHTLTSVQWAESIRSKRVQATDDFKTGLHWHPKDVALLKRHVGFNSPSMIGALTFDVDHEHAEWHLKSLMWDHETIPEPSWITVNPRTEHAHVGYLLEGPIPKTDAARRRPIEYAADIERTLTDRMGADRAYSGVTTRSPLHSDHAVLWGPSTPYSLGELHRALGDLSSLAQEPAQEPLTSALGRNCTVFNETRQQAYRLFWAHWKRGDQAGFTDAVHEHARYVNAEWCETPLSGTEVRGVARSVSRWTWRTFSANAERGTFSEIQTARSRKQETVVKRGQAVQMIRDHAVATGEVWTAAEVMDMFDVKLRTARNYLAEAGLVNPEARAVGDRPAQVRAMRAGGSTYQAIADELGLSVNQVRYALRQP